MDPTINIDVLPDKPKNARWEQIEAAIQAGKIVRFHYAKGFHKDVNSITKHQSVPECEHFDLQSFRRTGGRVEWVAWDSPDLWIEIVDE